jgi:hypothetical protein
MSSSAGYSLERLVAADTNDQFGCIIGDPDVSAFLKTAVLPHQDKIDKPNHKEMIKGIVEDNDSD